VPSATVPQLVAAAGPVVAAVPAMRLRVAGAGRFGSRRRPQVAWAGVAGDVAPLGELAAGLARVARAQRLEVDERPFRPHLTLGRWRPGRPADGDLVDRLSGYTGPVWPVREVRLVESRLGPHPEYVTVATWPVGDEAMEASPPMSPPQM
jgi:2'-5' RNA ligase